MQETTPTDRPNRTGHLCRITCLALTLLLAALCGCITPPKAYRFTSTSVTKVTYDPKQCIEQANGTFKCKEVLFTVSGIEPAAK